MKLITSIRTAALLAVAALGVSACAPQTNSAIYTTGQAMQANHVQYGVITDVRMIEMRHMAQGDQAAGVLIGGALGALAGAEFGNGSGKTLMTGAGAIAGAAAGSSVAANVNRTQATEWFVRLESGRTISVVQNDPNLRVGARIKVIQDGRSTRLVY